MPVNLIIHQMSETGVMKHGPHSQQPTKGTLLNWITNGGRLLAWIGDQVRLKALLPNKRGLIYRRRHSLVLNGNKGEPIRGELKHKEAIRISQAKNS